MSATPKPRKRDRLKAVFRSRHDCSVSPAPAHEVATQSPLQPSQTKVPLPSSYSEVQAITLDSTATLDSSIYLDENNDRMRTSISLAQDSRWEDALSKLEKSSSMEDRSHAHSLRKLMKTQNQDLSRQLGGAGSDGNDLIEMVKRAAEARRAEAETKAWKIEVGTQTIVLRDVATKIIDCLNKFKEIGDLAVQYDPIHAALPWAAFRFLLQVATINQEQTYQLLNGIDTATQAYLRAIIYQDLYLDLPNRQDIVDALRSSIVELLVAICAFMGLAIKIFSSGSVKNAAQGLFNPESLAKCIGKITETETQVEKNALSYKAVLDAAAHQRQGLRYDKLVSILETYTDRFEDIQIGLKKVKDEMGELAKTLSDKDIHEIFSWISGIPYESDLYHARRGRLEGTCEWLIAHETYKQWKSSPESTTLWLHGIPGAGKTKLSTKVVDDLAPIDMPLAYFFCDRNQENRSDPLTVLHSVTRQLSRIPHPKRIHACTIEAYFEKKKHSFASDKLTNEEARDLLLKLTNENSRSTIVIDGLDECNEESRKYILDTFDHILKHSSSVVKVFVASRNDKDLTQHYSDSPNLEIEAAHNQDDIEKLVMGRVASSQWAAKGMSVPVRDSVVRLFREKSQGMFQWAALHIDELLELESDQAILRWLHSLPEGLKAAYDRIYNALGARSRIYANRAFMWLMATHHHEISPELLCVLVCQDVNLEFDFDAKLSPGSLLSACRNLIKVDASDGGARHFASGRDDEEASKACRFAHLSVQEYLETQCMSVVEAKRMVLEISLKFWHYLSTTGDQTDLNDQDSKAKGNSTYKQLQLVTAEAILDFFDYADMSSANQDIWDQLLQSTKGHDVVLGSPCWRAIYEGAGIHMLSFPRLKEDELRALASPIGMCAWFENQKPLRHWIENGSFKPMDDRETARNLVSATYRLQLTAVCNLLLDAGTTFEGESRHMLKTRMDGLFQPVDTLEEESFSTLIRLLNHLFDHGACPKFCPSDRSIYDGTYPLEATRILLSHGVSLDVYDYGKRTPLMYAVSQGDRNMEMIELLLQHGADVKSMDVYGETPMHYATRNYYEQISEGLETVKLLLNHGADPNAGPAEYGTILMQTVRCGDAGMETTKLLLQHGANVSAIDMFGQMPLHHAGRGGLKYTETMRLLLDRGADPNAGATGNITPLQFAARDADIEAVKLLLRSNARVDTLSRYHGTALHAAALRGSQGKEVYSLLLEHGANPDLECEVGEASRSWGKISAKKILQTILMEEEHGSDWGEND